MPNCKEGGNIIGQEAEGIVEVVAKTSMFRKKILKMKSVIKARWLGR